MRDEVIIGSSVGAIADPSAVGDLDGYTFVIASMHFWNNVMPHIASTGITGAEVVTLWKLTAGVWENVYDDNDTKVQLTATKPQKSFTGEGTYGLSKSSGTGIVATVQMP